ncbi:hypothetical protein GLOIN_2v1473636 [Rhizophagus clarus]|uniref:MIR domain-containing protein n=1 Tax=Rhizophagus clarus TaxID=94130 RepID=A0A8H3LXP9_9GLOM|nr:hypothetical protein GLOIN_2v1473636 [Rhizophagus clarus]
MDFPKYDGNIHPDEWINDIKEYFRLQNIPGYCYYLKDAMSFIDSTIISLPAEINSFEELSIVLKEDISFTVFKCTNKGLLRSLKYIPEREGGNTSKFISNFRKLCYNAEINDLEEQKNYLCNSLLNNECYNYHLEEFFKRKKRIETMNDLVKEFTEIVTEELSLIRKGSIVALKHIATGKYLSSIEGLYYTTGSAQQLVFADSPELNLNALWKIDFSKELAIYDKTSINLQHIKSGCFLGAYNYNYLGVYTYFKSPITEHTEVSCIGVNGTKWMITHSKLENHKGYLSHDIQFTIGNDTFQEVVCHDERLGGNDEWCIELIKQG